MLLNAQGQCAVYSTDSDALVISAASAVACFRQVLFGCGSNAAGLGLITFTRRKVYK